MDRSKNVLSHEISHKEIAQDLDAERNSSKNVEGAEYDYAKLDGDMKQQLTQNTERMDSVENRNPSALGTKQSMKSRPSESGARNSSHQTNLRYTLQKNQ